LVVAYVARLEAKKKESRDERNTILF
jgi:hypothetical protein